MAESILCKKGFKMSLKKVFLLACAVVLTIAWVLVVNILIYDTSKGEIDAGGSAIKTVTEKVQK